jgi:uncharacterized protein (TIGR02246 family)
MKKNIFFVILLAIGLLNMDVSYSAKYSSTDTKQLSMLVEAYELGWNTHDVGSLARLFTDDVAFVTVNGLWLKSRGEFAEVHEKLHHDGYKNSIIKANNYYIDFLEPNIALIHWYWQMQGVENADGTKKPPYKGIFTWVVVKDGPQWYVRASHNTIDPS